MRLVDISIKSSAIFCQSFCCVAGLLLVFLSLGASQYLWGYDNYAYNNYYTYQEVQEMSVSLASNRFSDLGEGPFWDQQSQTLLYVDAFVGDICRLEPQSRETETIHFDGKTVTFVIPYSTNARKMLISVENEVRELHWDNRATNVMVVPDSTIIGNRFNDAKVDFHGRLWAGTLNSAVKESGFLYRVDTNFQYTRFAEKMSVSNGITWTLDNRMMFFIDSDVRRIYQFDYDITTGAASNQQILLDFNANPEYHDYGYPDGMTTDEEGKLWVACFAGGRILRIDPYSGAILRVVLLPVTYVTSVAFGGPHYDELYVTTAKRGMTADKLAQEPWAGGVLKITGLGVRGRPAYTFGL